MTYAVKRKTLILLGLMMIVMIIISASLSHLELKPGMPVPSLQNGQVLITPIQEEPLAAIPVNEVFNVLLIIAITGVILYLGYRMIDGIEWKTLASFIQRVLVVFLSASGIIFLLLLFLPKVQHLSPTAIPIPTPVPLVTTPLEPVPVSLLWLIGILLLAGVVFVGVWIFVQGSMHETTVMDIIGLEAEKAWLALVGGRDLKNVIVKCYQQMSMALAREQGIKRKDFMTAREFEGLLETVGVPRDPVHQLTSLFEAVRYGNWQPGPLDEQKAIHCFQEIIAYCHEHKQVN